MLGTYHARRSVARQLRERGRGEARTAIPVYVAESKRTRDRGAQRANVWIPVEAAVAAVNEHLECRGRVRIREQGNGSDDIEICQDMDSSARPLRAWRLKGKGVGWKPVHSRPSPFISPEARVYPKASMGSQIPGTPGLSWWKYLLLVLESPADVPRNT